MSTQVRAINPATYEGGFPVVTQGTRIPSLAMNRRRTGRAAVMGMGAYGRGSPMVASRLPPDPDPWSAEGMGFQVAPQGSMIPRLAMNRSSGGDAAIMGYGDGMWYGLGQDATEEPFYKRPWVIGVGAVALVAGTWWFATQSV